MRRRFSMFCLQNNSWSASSLHFAAATLQARLEVKKRELQHKNAEMLDGFSDVELDKICNWVELSLHDQLLQLSLPKCQIKHSFRTFVWVEHEYEHVSIYCAERASMRMRRIFQSISLDVLRRRRQICSGTCVCWRRWSARRRACANCRFCACPN
jgi:hypothetical protein